MGEGPNETQSGGGTDDGVYKHSSQDMGSLLSLITTEAEGDIYPQVSFAQLEATVDGEERSSALEEAILVLEEAVGDIEAGYYYYPNNGNGSFGTITPFDTGDSCKARGLRWGDLNNDGLDDYLCIGAEGNLYASINRGGSPPEFEFIGEVRAAPDDYYVQANVRLGDIDGDGRIDYCVVDDGSGDMTCWRNGGQKEAPTDEYGGYWQDLGVVFSGDGTDISLESVGLVDSNGDFRSDYLLVDDEGQTQTWMNQRGSGAGSLAPAWQDAGVTHAGVGVTGARDRVKFSRVFGSGRADYVFIESTEGNNGWDHSASVWKNTGSGGTMLKSDGNYYCDMRGTGSDDFIW